jgi:hypothetical protein
MLAVGEAGDPNYKRRIVMVYGHVDVAAPTCGARDFPTNASGKLMLARDSQVELTRTGGMLPWSKES